MVDADKRFKPPNELLRINDLRVVLRFVKGVKEDKETGCWLWQRYISEDKYGQMWYQGRAHWVHRIAYALFVDTIPPGLTVDHTCCNPSCCNPAHLRLQTHLENSSKKHEDIPI